MSVIGGASDSAFSQLSEANYSTASKKAQDLVGSSDSQKIERSAKQFESILLASWLQQAEKSFATAPGGNGDDDSADPGKKQFQSYAMQAVATALTNAGGIGIAPMIAKGLEKAASSAAAATDPADTEKTEQSLRRSSRKEKM
jgi:Rod binding domain-containing protein